MKGLGIFLALAVTAAGTGFGGYGPDSRVCPALPRWR